MPPVIVAAAAAAGAAATSGFVATALTNIAVGAALSAVSGAMAKKPKQQASFSARASDRTISVRQAIAHWQIIYGEVGRVTGPPTFMHITETGGNKYFHVVYTIAGHQIESIDKIYFNGEEVVFDGNGDATGKYEGYAKMDQRLGSPDQTAFAGLIADAPDKWTSDHRQRGCACVYIRFKWKSDLYPGGGLPNVNFDVKGKNNIYDPRTSTYGYTNNAALIVGDYFMEQSFGMAAPQDEMDMPTLIEAANICDENVALKAGGTEKRYTANGTFTVEEKPRDIIPQLLTACGGKVVENGGEWSVYVAAYRAPVTTVGLGDLRGPLEVQTLVSRRDNFNAVKGVFVSPENNWQPSDFPGVTSSTFETEDGEQVYKDIELPFTTSPSMAQRLAKIDLLAARQPITITAPVNISKFKAMAGDVLQFDDPDRYGFSNKPFEVIESGFAVDSDGEDPIYGVDLLLRETDPSIYDWSTSEEQDYDPAPNTTLPSLQDVSEPTGLALASGTDELFLRQDGTVFSRIKVSWAASTDAFVLSGGYYEVQYKKSSDSEWEKAGNVDGEETFTHILEVEDSQNYDVRIRAVNVGDAKSDWVSVLGHTVVGKTAPPSDVVGFSAQQNGDKINFSWNAVSDSDLSGYDIRYGVVGSSFDDAQPLTEETKGSRITSAAVPPGDWQFSIKAIDSSGNKSQTAATFNLLVKNTNDVIDIFEQFPLWSGSVTNMTVNPLTGNLVPSDQHNPNVDGQEVFEKFVVQPYDEYAYESDEIDLGFDSRVRAHASVQTTAGGGETVAIIVDTQLDSKEDGGSYGGFSTHPIGEVDARYLKVRCSMRPDRGLGVINSFAPTVDAEVREESGEVDLSASGTHVTFENQFHEKPNLTVSAEGVALVANYENLTSTGFDCKIYNKDGTAVSGTISWSARSI